MSYPEESSGCVLEEEDDKISLTFCDISQPTSETRFKVQQEFFCVCAANHESDTVTDLCRKTIRAQSQRSQFSQDCQVKL